MGFLRFWKRLWKDDRTYLQPSIRHTLQPYYEQQLALQQQKIEFQQQQIEALKQDKQELLNLVNKLSSQPNNITINAMAENQNSNINPSGGSFVNTGEIKLTGSTINLGEISGSVTNTLQQLQDTTEPTAQTLAALLKELQTAIETTPDLDEKNKTKALKHLDALGKLGNDRSNSTLQEAAETAWDALTGILGKATQLLPIADKLLPTIQKLLGL